MRNPAEVLLQKRSELLANLARLKGEAREPEEEAVRDFADNATVDETSGEAFQEITLASDTLEQVEDALKRIADGTYGRCIICGRPISSARLEAIPWTPYCLEDQEKLNPEPRP